MKFDSMVHLKGRYHEQVTNLTYAAVCLTTVHWEPYFLERFGTS